MNKSLFQIKDDAMAIYNMIEQADGEINEELENALKITESELKTKAMSYAGLVKALASDTNEIKAEIKRLQSLVKRNNHITDRLKNTLSDAMFTFQQDEISTSLTKISFRKSESLVINCDVQDLPDDCKIIKTEPISKTELKKQLKDGRIIDGVEIVQNLNIQIK